MAAGEFRNPAVLDDSSGSVPANNTVAVYQASTDTWVPTAIASIGSPLTVPGSHIAQVVAANAATQTGSYVQADVQTIATLANELKTKFDTLLTELATAGILS